MEFSLQIAVGTFIYLFIYLFVCVYLGLKQAVFLLCIYECEKLYSRM